MHRHPTRVQPRRSSHSNGTDGVHPIRIRSMARQCGAPERKGAKAVRLGLKRPRAQFCQPGNEERKRESPAKEDQTGKPPVNSSPLVDTEEGQKAQCSYCQVLRNPRIATRLSEHLASDCINASPTVKKDFFKYIKVQTHSSSEDLGENNEISVNESTGRKKKKQGVLTITPAVKHELDSLLTQFVVMANMPFSVSSDSYFRAFVNRLSPDYQVPDRHRIGGELLTALYKTIEEDISKKIERAINFCIMIDGWSNVRRDVVVLGKSAVGRV
ncbi:hypothetical protein DMENIID0001_016390 [Sergentomyia squamirostris]